MGPIDTFSFFFFDLVPLFVDAIIFAAGNVQTDLLSDKGIGVVFCAFCVVDTVISGLVCADAVGFKAFADAVGFEAFSLFG